jgi:hypothetical protein
VPPLIELSPGHLVACHHFPAPQSSGIAPQAEPSVAPAIGTEAPA